MSSAGRHFPSPTSFRLPTIDRTEQGRITKGTPRTKAFVATDWTLGDWTLHGQVTRYGTWTSYGTVTSGDQTYGSRYVLDLSAAYNWNDWTFTVGGNDVNDAYPEKNDAANSSGGILPYPNTSPFGFAGAYYYATVAYHW